VTIERSGLQKQLDLLEERRAQIEAAIATAETEAYLTHASHRHQPNPMSEMAIINLPSKVTSCDDDVAKIAAGMILLLIVGIKRIRPRHNLLLTLLFAQFVLPAQAQSQPTESITAFARGHGSIVSAVKSETFCRLCCAPPNGQAVITLTRSAVQVRGTCRRATPRLRDTTENHWRRTRR
jgi:hypothetical protein